MSREENRNNNEENNINEPKNQDSVSDKAGTDAAADSAEKESTAPGEADKEIAAPNVSGTEAGSSGKADKEGGASVEGEKPPAGSDVESVHEGDKPEAVSEDRNSVAGSGGEAVGSPDSGTAPGLEDKGDGTDSNLEDTIIAPSSRAGDSSTRSRSKYGVSKRESVFVTPAAVSAGENDNTEKIIGPDTDKEAAGNTAAETEEAREEDMASGKPKTREERRKEKEQQEGKKGKKKRKGRIRLIPVWLRLVIVLFLFAASLVIGAMVGYGIIGEGNPMDIFEQETWLHIYDIIYEGTNLNGGGGE
ncbi:DNA-directed RNA polymerase subunit beta [Evansella clarkii]|jgi:hypothetical protein|uniref:DNA-directed RNA polymerase subunit beta n=1 Tax=Evansella clarkii TaxID=79879 RepID=UPI001FD4E6A9|nr:DNA-directed RNA polymerase subunit beta [Evansella clarkii]